MEETIITFKISSFDFAWIWNQYIKEGGQFNEFLVDYYIEEIAEKFPKVDVVIPKVYLTLGNGFGLSKLLVGNRGNDSNQARKLRENFFVNGDKIKNPIEVGI